MAVEDYCPHYIKRGQLICECCDARDEGYRAGLARAREIVNAVIGPVGDLGRPRFIEDTVAAIDAALAAAGEEKPHADR